MRLTNFIAAFALVAGVAACSDSGPVTHPYITLVSASTITDTTNAKVADLIVQARDSTGRTSYQNLTIRFATDAVSANGNSSAVAKFTDADGRVFSNGQEYTNASGQVVLHMQLGSIPGAGTVHVSLGGQNSLLALDVTVTAPPVP